MRAKFRPYAAQDRMKVREFLSSTYAKLQRPNTWTVARWEFEIFFVQKKAGMLPDWEQHIGLWEDEDGYLVAVACRDGDYYFQSDTFELPEELWVEMFEFIEKNSLPLSTKLAIPRSLPNLEQIARNRGYKMLEHERDTVISIKTDQEFPVALPNGIFLRRGDEVPDQAKAQGHIMAFGYSGTKESARLLQHYGGLREAPGYRPELDLSLVNASEEVVAFCNIFVDEANRIGIFEPVGTHPDYRRRGLGGAVIHEGLNRMRELGMTKAYTGPMQPFYQELGFEIEEEMIVWEKERKQGDN